MSIALGFGAELDRPAGSYDHGAPDGFRPSWPFMSEGLVGTKGLAVIALLLAVVLALAWSNPTAQEYERYQDELLDQALTRIGESDELASRGVLRQLVKSKEGLFLKALIRSQTTRVNLGLFSLFDTKLLATRLRVLGVGGKFIPLTDPEETLRELERTAIAPSR